MLLLPHAQMVLNSDVSWRLLAGLIVIYRYKFVVLLELISAHNRSCVSPCVCVSRNI